MLNRQISVAIASLLAVFFTLNDAHSQELSSSPEYSGGMNSYMKGEYEEAKQYWLSAAQNGNAKAMFNLGLLHEREQIADSDSTRANQWFEQAGNAGYPAADYHLALRLRESGQYAKSTRLLERSAQAGFVLAKELVSTDSEKSSGDLPSQTVAAGASPNRVSSSAVSSSASSVNVVPVASNSDHGSAQQASASSRAYQRESWLLKQASDFWTIQMLAFSDEVKVRNFIDDHKLHSNAAYFSEGRDGRAVYKLVYGAYASKERADQARTKLPLELKKHGPWLREIKAVQEIIDRQK